MTLMCSKTRLALPRKSLIFCTGCTNAPVVELPTRLHQLQYLPEDSEVYFSDLPSLWLDISNMYTRINNVKTINVFLAKNLPTAHSFKNLKLLFVNGTVCIGV